MYRWETAFRYALFHERWFESADAYGPGDEHLSVFWEVMPDDWTLRRMGMNLVAAAPGAELPDQGWKLHVSSSSQHSAEVLCRALPVLRDAGVRFKFLADRRLTHVANSKLCSRGTSGKFITVYPRNDEEFRALAAGLATALDGFTGPYVLSDRRVPGSHCVSYRYGGFRARWKLHPDGGLVACIQDPDGREVPDVRNPYFSPPPWAADPFGHSDGDDQEREPVIGGGRFVVEEALSFSNRGGVYRAHDRETGRTVVIKEARPLIELDSRGCEAVSSLAKEYHLLSILQDSGYFVRPVAYFTEWEHTFLVEEYVSGSHLGTFIIGNNPLYRTRLTRHSLCAYWQRMQPIWMQIGEAIAQAHDRGILLADLSFTNIMVPESAGTIKIIDLEAAVRPGVDPPMQIFTRGLASDRFARTGICDEANDYHALGGIIFGSLALQHSLLGFHPGAFSRLLDELTTDLGLPQELPVLITYLQAGTTPDTGSRPHDPALVTKRIREIPLEPSDPPALAAPAQDETSAELRERVEQAIEGICRHITATADPRRSDRLFPADLLVFETNPMSVAYGACGVAHSLHLITGDVPPQIRGWLLREPVTSGRLPPGLYTGLAGIAWVFDELGYTELALRAIRQASQHALLSASADVFSGAAGYGLACLHLWHRTGQQWLLDEAVKAGSQLAGQRRDDERGSFWPDDQDQAHIGFAYGSSGIAAFLLYLYLAAGDPAMLALSRDALRFDLAHAGRIDGEFAGFPALSTDEEERKDAAHVFKGYWDEGSAGVGTALVRYLATHDDPALWPALAEIIPDTCRKYAVLPQLFHGLAGAGNFLLDLWELSGDARYLAEAWRTAEGVLLFGVQRPEGLAFPGEHAMRESTDFATGSAGVALFLHRLLNAGSGTRTSFSFLPDELLPEQCPARQCVRGTRL